MVWNNFSKINYLEVILFESLRTNVRHLQCVTAQNFVPYFSVVGLNTEVYELSP